MGRMTFPPSSRFVRIAGDQLASLVLVAHMLLVKTTKGSNWDMRSAIEAADIADRRR